MDRDAGRSLTAFVSSDKRLAMWQIIADEEDRVADYKREFPCEFRIIARLQMAWNPFIGHHICLKVTVEGETDRHFREANHQSEKIDLMWLQFIKGVIYGT